jgi:beta-galactosidase
MCVFLFSVSSYANILTVDTKSHRKQVNINQGWKYNKGSLKQTPTESGWTTKGWEQVTLPHSYQLTSINLDDSTDDKSQKTFHRDVSWYQKTIDIKVNNNQKVFLEFEGAHQRTQLWVNNRYVGEHATGGYTPFHFDITQYVKPNQENTLVVFLDNRVDKDIPPDGHVTDYVLFGGLYRDVYLTVTDDLHFTYNWESKTSGIFVTTPTVNERDATVSIRSEITNSSSHEKKFTVLTQIVDAKKNVVAKVSSNHKLAANSKEMVKHTTGLTENVQLWSPDNPYLYRVHSQIVANGKNIDSLINPLGLRTFELRLNEGLLLNGKPIEIIGANRHQHYPYIGDAVPNNLHRNDAIKFKESGMNLVRLAHYPHDNSFLEACDELGLIVVEEPPTWIEFGDEVWFDRLEQASRVMIRNHRNHPSILGWGAGINHRGTIKRMHYAAKEEDPTRITMNNGTLWTGEQHSGITDLYAVMDYRGAMRQPHDMLFAMEHSGTRDSLGLQEIVSRYKGDPNLIGLASWSGHDSNSFIKRDKQYPNLSVWGISSWDAFRSPKPIYYWYKSELTTEPMVHIPDQGGQVKDHVQVFSNADSIELLHNGKSIGVFSPTGTDKNKHLNSPSTLVPFDWKSGVVTAYALEDGKRIVSHSRAKTTPQDAVKIDLAIDTTGYDFYADGSSILMAYAYIKDANGHTVEVDTPYVTFKVTGDAEIVGNSSIGANPVTWRNGIAPVMIRVGNSPSRIVLSASSEGLGSAQASLQTTAWSPTQHQEKHQILNMPLSLKVDLGNNQQHPQEGFELWSSNEGSQRKTFVASNAQHINVSVSANNKLEWKHTWGMPGDLSFMIEDGVEVLANDTITLQFENLPKGKFNLKTWHHMLTDKRKNIPSLVFDIKPKRREGKSTENYSPTFGQRIKVSEAGGGTRGDGGSNKGALGFASHSFISNGQGKVSLTINAKTGEINKDSKFRLNGFELNQLN